MPRGELRGVWFRLDRADVLRRAELQRDEYALQIEAYDTIEKIRDDQIRYIKASSDVYREAAIEASKATKSAEKAYASERKRARAWHRQPILWFGVGVVSAVVTTIGLSKVLN